MGLIEKLTEKLKAIKFYISRAFMKTPDKFIFKDFKENFMKNDKVMDKKWQQILADANKIRKRQHIEVYRPDVENELEETTLDIMEITNSERFSTNFADFITCVKLYAVNYMITDEGKTESEVVCACNRLESVVECLKFNFLTHVNIETDHWIEPDGDLMTITKKKGSRKTYEEIEKTYDLNINQEEGYVLKLLKMQQKVFDEILNIAQGIYDGERDPVYKGFVNLSDKDFYQLEELTEEEKLDLQ